MGPPALKLLYFPVPGRGEVTRLMLDYAGIPFEDKHVTDWHALKPSTPFGQLPVMEVDGTMLAQSTAIERYAAKLAGLYPTDLWEAAKVDEAVAFVQEIQDLFIATYAIQDPEEKIKARQVIVAGPLAPKLQLLTKLLGGKEFLTGDKISYADFVAFKFLSGLVGGSLDGIPTDLLNSYPELKAYHNRIAELPAVAKRYADVTEGIMLSYKPLP